MEVLELMTPHRMEPVQGMVQEQRIFTRVPFARDIQWHDAHNEDGAARIKNVSRSGVALSLGRYLRPGPVLVFRFDDVLFNNRPVEISALTVWCRPEPDSPDRFQAGFAVVHGEPHTLGAISEVFYAAIREAATSCMG